MTVAESNLAGPGNLNNLRHGAFSERVLSERSVDIADALFECAPWLLDSDAAGIEHYCRAEARARLLDEFAWSIVEGRVSVGGRVGVIAVPPYIWREITGAENNAMRAATSLGLNTEGRLKIAKDAGFAHHFGADRLGTLISRGRELRRGAA